MTTQHTPGCVEHDMRGYPHSDVRSVSGRKIANTWGTGHPKTSEAYKHRTEQDRANARRIVACWNACEGIPTEELEASARPIAAAPDLLEALKLMVKTYAAPGTVYLGAHPIAVARAAIAKAEGGEA